MQFLELVSGDRPDVAQQPAPIISHIQCGESARRRLSQRTGRLRLPRVGLVNRGYRAMASTIQLFSEHGDRCDQCKHPNCGDRKSTCRKGGPQDNRLCVVEIGSPVHIEIRFIQPANSVGVDQAQNRVGGIGQPDG